MPVVRFFGAVLKTGAAPAEALQRCAVGEGITPARQGSVPAQHVNTPGAAWCCRPPRCSTGMGALPMRYI
jgi:hypothetical protein